MLVRPPAGTLAPLVGKRIGSVVFRRTQFTQRRTHASGMGSSEAWTRHPLLGRFLPLYRDLVSADFFLNPHLLTLTVVVANGHGHQQLVHTTRPLTAEH